MSAAPVIPMPPQQELQRKATQWTELARDFKIADKATYELAAEHLQTIKGLQAEADKTFDPIIRKAHEAHKEALAQKKRINDPLLQAESLLKSTMGAYVREQERKRQEEERRLREQQERLAAEQREAEIEEAEAAGASVEEVAAIAEAPLRYAPVIVTQPPRTAGISSREIWKAEITSMQALVKFVAANPQYLNLLQANTAAIGGLARSLKSTMHIPGIRVYSEANIAARRC